LMHFYCTESYKSLAGFADRIDNAYVLRWDTVPKLAFHVVLRLSLLTVESCPDARSSMLFSLTSSPCNTKARSLRRTRLPSQNKCVIAPAKRVIIIESGRYERLHIRNVKFPVNSNSRRILLVFPLVPEYRMDPSYAGNKDCCRIHVGP
jgi:hypothetical protein